MRPSFGNMEQKTPVTVFAVKDSYKYLEGLGNYHS